MQRAFPNLKIRKDHLSAQISQPLLRIVNFREAGIGISRRSGISYLKFQDL
jgi:hypothetical protein